MNFRNFILLFFVLIDSMSCSIKKKDEIITTNAINPSDIQKISKFRSCCGHDYSGGDESNRSMKHYFTPLSSFGISNTSLPVHAPFDGEITSIHAESHRIDCFNDTQGSQIEIVPYARPDLKIKLFHMNPLVSKGRVKSGDLIAYADLRTCDGAGGTAMQGSFDISIEHNGLKESYFDYASGSILDAWIARGIGTKDNAIISKSSRDQNQCTQFASTQCSSEEVNFP